MSMTASQLYDKTTEIMDDEKISESLFLTLLSLAKNSRENERPWQFLKKEDSSQSASAGDTYLTMKTLVSDFAHALHLYVGTSFLEYEEIPFEDRRYWRDAGRKFYVDIRNSQFAITGAGESGTIFFNYTAFTSDPTQLGDTMPTAWPDRFLPLLSFDVAALYRGGTDYDDVNARMSQENRLAAKFLHDALVSWDNMLKLKAINMQARRTALDIRRVPNVPNIF